MTHIIGLDEVGYGSWAGPVVVGAVRAPANWTMPGLKDSKKLSRDQREVLSGRLKQLAELSIIDYTIESESNINIDELGLAACHKMCYSKAMNTLYKPLDNIIIDGNLNPKLFVNHGLDIDLININSIKSVIKADDQFPTVMAASILAKHYRDTLMIKAHDLYPHYEWSKNVGYIVANHRAAAKTYGLSPLHRKSYNVKL